MPGGDAQRISRIHARFALQPAISISADVHHAGTEAWLHELGRMKRHDDPIERFLVAYGGDLKQAQREREFPDLAEENIHAACAIGDPDGPRTI
jgi:hypothetical protein